MDKNKIEEYINTALQENESLFLIDLLISAENKISILIDGDKGVPLKECIKLSRFVEGCLDREEEDFSIEVTTPDIAKPIVMKRQYIKNVGRIVSVVTKSQTYDGTLSEVTDSHILLKWQAREPKKIGKGKVTVDKSIRLAYTDIEETKVKILFS